jgi:hypothetical protein
MRHAAHAQAYSALDPSWKQKEYPSTINFDLEIGDETTAGGCAGGKLNAS